MSEISTQTTKFPLWWHKFNYSKRHCWKDSDGNYRIDGSGESRKCHKWHEHIYQAGPTEFLRWIRTFGAKAPGIVTKFSDSWLHLEPATMLVPEYAGKVMYCENYGGVVRAFLNPYEGWAVVEIQDRPDLFVHADEAILEVNEEYAMELQSTKK